jgi:topoisomerase-4 subunit B
VKKSSSQGDQDNSSVYDESKIKTLSSIDHIRLRPGMYIGRLGKGKHADDGIYVLIKEVIDNGIDEYIMGYGKKIKLTLVNDIVEVRDYGRGIPLGKLIECVSIINTGAKYNDDVFQFSVGLNGVGTKAVNALSEFFEVTSFRDGKFRKVVFEKGILVSDETGEDTKKNGTLVRFIPDREIFKSYEFDHDFIKRRMRFYSYLNDGLTINFNKEKFFSPNGLKDLLETEIQNQGMYEVMHFKKVNIQFAFVHTHSYGETFFSFVNGQYTNDGGTHLSAFKEGLVKGVNEFYQKSFQGSDVREGIVGAIAIRIKEPVFESQTKNKLGNTDIKSWIVNATKSAVVDFLYQHPEDADILLRKAESNENIRKELASVRKEARSKAKKISLKIPNLRDCKCHRGDGTARGAKSMIFLTEGHSAAGSMMASRDVYTQAVFSLRGKPLNCFGTKRDALYKNNELYNLMQALDIETSVENLRYSQIIIATDSDVDGMHIRNLLLTFFLHYFESIVMAGHVFILETPLFRVRNKNKTFYCYDEKDRQEAMKSIPEKGREITRFKGLGEISPKEFGQFIGDDIRLQDVAVEQISEVPDILKFFMGKNTPKRREFIMQNLE